MFAVYLLEAENILSSFEILVPANIDALIFLPRQKSTLKFVVETVVKVKLA